LVKLGLSLLKNIDYLVVPMDKSYGYVLIHRTKVQSFEQLAFSPKFYRPVVMACINLDSLRAQCGSIARRIQALEDAPGLAAILSSSLHLNMVAMLGYTVKTHKAQGMIVPRTLHKSYAPAFDGLSRWLTQKLDPVVQAIPHLMKDSFAFRAALKSISFTIPTTARMAVIDIKDFFLSGSPVDLSNDVSTSFSGSEADMIKETSFTLLDNQFVAASSLECAYRCYCGSGIGLRHSPNISNLAFFNAVETKVLPRFYRMGVLLYLRYFDDIFILFDARDSMYNSCRFFKERSSYFTLKVDSVSATQVGILDLNISIVDGSFQVQPKGDKLPQPLCPSSAHAGHVHSSWPTAVRCRTRALADFPEVADAKLRLNYQLAGTHSITMCKLSGPLPIYCRRDPVDTQQPTVACVMRFHPLFPKALKVALRQAPLPPSVNFRIQPSWRNSLPSTLTFLNRHNDSLGSGLLVEGESLLSGRIKSTMHRISKGCFP